MQTRSSLQRRTNSEPSDRVIANPQPRSWGDSQHEQPQTTQPQSKGQDFSHVDLFAHDPGSRSLPRGIQAKLTVGAPNDVYEQEADRVAEQVISTPDSAIHQSAQRDNAEEPAVQTKPLAATITLLVQRDIAPEEEEDPDAKAVQGKLIQREAALPEEEEELQTKPLATMNTPLVQREAMPEEEEELQTKPLAASIQREAMPEEEEELQTKSLGSATLQREGMPEEEEELQTKRSPDAGFQSGSNLENRLNSSQGGGSLLPADVRAFMEPRFGADFSQVRVHTGSESVQMNRDLNAQAFTHKQDVYFGAGKAPAKDALTAHELTHVVQQSGRVHAETISLSNLDSTVTQSANFPMLQLKHLTIDEAVKSFKDVVTPDNETLGSKTLVESGQFYWTEQIRFAISQRINSLRFIPASSEWQELLNDLDRSWKQWPLDKAAQDSQKVKQKIADIRKRAKKSDPIAISLLPLLPMVEPLLKPAPKSGKAIYYELWSHLQKGDQIPSLIPYQSLPTLQAISSWEIQACGFTGSQAANRYTHKGGVKKENPDAKRSNSTKAGASFAGSATRDMRPAADGFRLGDVLNQNGVAGAVPKMKAALEDGWILHARVLSGIDYGHGDAAVAFDKQAAKGKAPKQPQRLGKPPEEHSIMIIGYDGNEFVFWDPDSGSSNLHGAGFGSLFFSGGKLSTAPNNVDIEVDIAGNHSSGEHRYQVIHLGSQ